MKCASDERRWRGHDRAIPRLNEFHTFYAEGLATQHENIQLKQHENIRLKIVVLCDKINPS